MEKVKFEGKTYILQGNAYVEDGFNRESYDLPLDDERPFYKALATDEEGNSYEVTWDVKDNWEEVSESGDEHEMVEDWGQPSSVTKI